MSQSFDRDPSTYAESETDTAINGKPVMWEDAADTLRVASAAKPLPVGDATAQASLSVLDDWDESDRAKVNTIAGQIGVQGASGVVTALTQRVVLATDVALPAGDTVIGRVKLTDGTDVADILDLANSNPLTVALVDASGDQITSFGGGTQYAEDTVSGAGDIVTMAGVVRKDAGATLADADGDRTQLQVDASGALRVTGGGGGTEYTVDVAAPAAPVGTTLVMERDDQLAALTEIEGDWTNSRSTSRGALWVALADSAGDPITSFGGGTQYTEDVAAAADPVGTALIMVRADALAAVTTTDGDNLVARATNKGELYVKHADTLTISGAVTNTVLSVVGGGTEAAAQRVTIASDSTGVLSVDDNGASLTIDNAQLSVVGGGTEAAALRVTIANDSTGILSIDDNGGSITVDGAVTIGGAVDTELTTADLDTGAGTDTRAVVGMVLAASGGGLLVGAANPMPVSGTFWQATQPVSGTVSGTVTANAGTNLNTSLLALETGGNLGDIAASASILDDWDEVDRAKANIIVGQAGVAAGAGAVSVTVQRVTLASDDPAVVALQILDNAISGSEMQVDVVASLPAGTNAIGKLAANSGVDIGDVDVTSVTGTVTTKETRSAVGTTTQVADTATSTTILASNANRLGCSVQNDSSAVLYIKSGTTASATDYTARLVQYSYWEAPYGYTGRIDGIWATDPGDGAARVTEYT